MENKTQYSFDNDGNVILKNRAYRRQKIKMNIAPSNKPKKERKKRQNKRKTK